MLFVILLMAVKLKEPWHQTKYPLTDEYIEKMFGHVLHTHTHTPLIQPKEKLKFITSKTMNGTGTLCYVK